MTRRATTRLILVSMLVGAILIVLNACSKGRRPSDPVCVRWLNATMSWTDRCGVPLGIVVPTIGESRRYQYEAVCERTLFAPGATRARTYFEECAKKLEARECSLGEPFDCDPPPGELPNNAACAHDVQCASGWCAREIGFGATSSVLVPTCGICTPRLEIGEGCNVERFGERCAYGSHCYRSRCETERAGEGELCESDRACADGLRCERRSDSLSAVGARCVRGGIAGTACARSTDCAVGLVCAGDPGKGEIDAGPLFNPVPPFEPIDPGPPVGICRELRAGEHCTGKSGCLRGLGCDPDEYVCVPIKYVSPDEACDDNVRRCKNGPCVPTPQGSACPIPLDDNAPCTTADLCELPAVCNPQTGRCELPDPTMCK